MRTPRQGPASAQPAGWPHLPLRTAVCFANLTACGAQRLPRPPGHWARRPPANLPPARYRAPPLCSPTRPAPNYPRGRGAILPPATLFLPDSQGDPGDEN